MKLFSKKCFSKAMQVTDRFYVQKLTLEHSGNYNQI